MVLLVSFQGGIEAEVGALSLVLCIVMHRHSSRLAAFLKLSAAVS